MPKIVFLAIALLQFCNANTVAQPIVEVVKFDALQKLINRDSDRIEVINFWATWCKPCIKELPYFEALHEKMSDVLNVTLISLDFEDQLESKVVPFVQKRRLNARVLLLDEIDYNSWIDKVEATWTGAIPATLMINHRTGERRFVEQEMTANDIEKMVNELLD